MLRHGKPNGCGLSFQTKSLKLLFTGDVLLSNLPSIYRAAFPIHKGTNVNPEKWILFNCRFLFLRQWRKMSDLKKPS